MVLLSHQLHRLGAAYFMSFGFKPRIAFGLHRMNGFHLAQRRRTTAGCRLSFTTLFSWTCASSIYDSLTSGQPVCKDADPQPRSNRLVTQASSGKLPNRLIEVR